VLEAGYPCGLHRIERLMRIQALRARPRRRSLPIDCGQRSTAAIAPNLLDREFHATAPNQKWVGDFTYLWTAEGWLYVAVVLDLYSRRVVGWSMQSHMTTQLITDALMMGSGGGANPTGRGESRRVQLHRSVLQRETAPLDHRIHQSDAVRARDAISLGRCLPNRQQSMPFRSEA